MVDIYYPKVSESKGHVSTYFDNSPARTSSVLYHEFVSAASFGVDAISSIGGQAYASLTNDELLDEEQYKNSPYFREGVEVSPSGIRRSVAESIAESYDERFYKNLVLNRAKSGFGVSAARFSAGMVGSLLDPVNVGLAITAPMAVGLNATARAASMRAVSGVATKFGKTPAAIVAGAGEATVGALAFEPVALLGARIQQNPEYGLYDSFINLTAGAILGGTVTGVGSKFSEKFRRANVNTQIQAQRVANAQLLNGQPVNIDPILNTDPAISPLVTAERSVKAQRYTNKEQVPKLKKPKQSELPDALKPLKNKPKTITQFVIDNGKIDPRSQMRADLRQRLDLSAFRVEKRGGLTLEEMAEKAQDAGYFEGRFDTYNDKATPEDLINLLEQDQGGGVVFSLLDENAQKYLDALELDDRVSELGIDPTGMTDAELFRAIDLAEENLQKEILMQENMNREPGLPKDEFDTVVAQASRDITSPENDPFGVDFLNKMEEDLKRREASSKDVDSMIASVDEQITDAQSTLEAMRDNDLITAEEMAELAQWDDVVARADAMHSANRAAKSAAFCVNKNMTTPLGSLEIDL